MAVVGGLLAALLGAPACSRPSREADGPQVGTRAFVLPPPHGSQLPPLSAVAWYPAARDSGQHRRRYAQVFLGLAAEDAPLLQPTERRPTVILAHGLRGTVYDLSWLGERLAQAGYVAVAIGQPGVEAEDYDRRLAPKVWRRAQLLTATLDALLADPQWGAVVDPTRVAAVGHSAGGSAVLALAGAEVDSARFLRRYPDSGPVPAEPYSDPRFAGVVGLAPGTARVFADAGLKKVNRPVLVVSGDKDWLTPEDDNAARYAAQLPHVRWERLEGTGHYVFKPLCSLYGKLRARAICTDGAGVDRLAVHERTSRWVRTFLAQVFQGGPQP